MGAIKENDSFKNKETPDIILSVTPNQMPNAGIANKISNFNNPSPTAGVSHQQLFDNGTKKANLTNIKNSAIPSHMNEYIDDEKKSKLQKAQSGSHKIYQKALS